MARKKSAEEQEDNELAAVSYEEGYARLQEILNRLEGGDTSLEESLTLYAQGTRLAGHCAAKLEEAELTVRRWQEQGNATVFDEWREQGDS